MNTIEVILIIVTVVFVSALVYLIFDYHGPKKIPLKPDNKFGLVCFRAKDLIVQEFDIMGNLWASRGMIIYRLTRGDRKFNRITHVPGSFSLSWMNNFSFIRRLTVKPECMEILISADGKVSAFSSGYMWYSEDSKKFNKTLKLSNYGIGVGRGILSTGLLKVNEDLMFFGEYFRNDERTYVRVYKSKNCGQTWEIAYEFKPGIIRHIHALQVDPYTGKLWICTGDNDNESMIGWSEDDYKNIIPIGQGSQIWRACQLVFTEEAVYWGTDTDSENLSGIYRWDKKSRELLQLQEIHGAVFFGTRLDNGTIVMSTDREGFANEEDNKTRLFVINKNDRIITMLFGTWNHKKSGIRSNYAKLRIQRNQGGDSLIISCLNQKEIPDGDLLIYSEDLFN